MSYVGTGKIPTIDATAQDVAPGFVMPVLAQDKPKTDGVSLSALLGGWLAGIKPKANGRTYEQTVMPIVTEKKKTEDSNDSFTEAAPKS